MSEYLEKMIEAKAEELQKKMDVELRKFVTKLKKQVTVKVPTDVPRILAEGGIVESKEVNLPYSEAYLSVQMGDRRVLYDKEKDSPMYIDSGKYRVTLILERLGEADVSKGSDVTVNDC